MGFETIITPLIAPQVAVYAQPAASFSASALEAPIFGAKPRMLPLDGLLEEPHCHNGTREGWMVYDETHLFNPYRGESLYVENLQGKKYGEQFPARALPKFLLVQSHPRLEKMKAHVIEHNGASYILEAVSPAQELLFRRIGRPNWSGLGEDHLIVFKKDGEWMAEYQSVPTQSVSVDHVGDGTEDAHFQFGVLPGIPLYWREHNFIVPVETINPKNKELPPVFDVAKALGIMPPLLLGGLQAVQLVDENHDDECFAEMDPEGILRLYRGSRGHHLHATLFHELAHWFAIRVLGSVFLEEQAHWIRAMMKDAKNPSWYATTTIAEDFAESVALYFLTGGGRLGEAPVHFKNRFRLLDALFYDCFTPAYHGRHGTSTAAHSPVSI